MVLNTPFSLVSKSRSAPMHACPSEALFTIIDLSVSGRVLAITCVSGSYGVGCRCGARLKLNTKIHHTRGERQIPKGSEFFRVRYRTVSAFAFTISRQLTDTSRVQVLFYQVTGVVTLLPCRYTVRVLEVLKTRERRTRTVLVHVVSRLTPPPPRCRAAPSHFLRGSLRAPCATSRLRG